MKHLIDCAMGRLKSELVIKNVKIFNVFTGETEEGDVAVSDGRIAGIGSYDGEEVFDGEGNYLLPSFLESHIHVESSMLSPEEFARLSVPHGTGGIIADPHEIVNVCGVAGAEYIKEAFSRAAAPLDVYLQLPSCVPATPFETSGASIGGRETEEELARGLFFGLGEMMNFPGVLGCDEDVLRKLGAALSEGRVVDGHAPLLTGKELCAYRAAGVLTDHECLSREELLEKVGRGMYAQIRCGSSTNGIREGKEAVNGYNFRRFLLCSDDRNAADLFQGHMNDILARLVAEGVPAAYAVPMATINVAECYRLADVGAVAPRYFADLALVGDLVSFRVKAVFKRGKLVARDGKPLFGGGERYLPAEVRGTVRLSEVTEGSFRMRTESGRVRAIRMQPHSLFTEEVLCDLKKGEIDVQGTDLCKLAVVERHFATGRIGLGLVKGYGLKGGAIGISVAHDSHNLVVLGDDDGAMARVVSLLKEAGGGMAVADGTGEDVFPLDIAGLMSSAPAEEVVRRTAELSARARRMGVKEGYDPFMSLAFLSLPVIPKLKLTDRGLFDLGKFSFVPLDAEKD